MATKTKQARISAELEKLRALFASLPGHELQFLQPLMSNAAFMAVTLADLQEEINAGGTVDEYQNGSAQFGKKASATIQAYNATMKVYLATMRDLLARLPKEQRTSALTDLLNGGGDE